MPALEPSERKDSRNRELDSGCRVSATILYKCDFRRERLSVRSNDTDFFSVDAREFHSLLEEGVFLILLGAS